MRLADHDERLSAVHQAETRYEVSVDTCCESCVAKRANPDIAVSFEARQIVAGRHSIAPIDEVARRHAGESYARHTKAKQRSETSRVHLSTLLRRMGVVEGNQGSKPTDGNGPAPGELGNGGFNIR